MDEPTSWEGISALIFTRDEIEGVPVRIIRFLGAYVEVERQGKARLYPRENIAYFAFLGASG